MLHDRRRRSIEPEVDLAGYWLDGDTCASARVRIGAEPWSAPVAPCSGRRSGSSAEIAPGSAVFGAVPAGQRWAGSPPPAGQGRAAAGRRTPGERGRRWLARLRRRPSRSPAPAAAVLLGAARRRLPVRQRRLLGERDAAPRWPCRSATSSRALCALP